MFVMCELIGMEKPTVKDLAGKARISKSYACEILGSRVPSRPLAIHILRTTGWRHDCIADLSDEDIETFERVDPWAPPAAKTEAA